MSLIEEKGELFVFVVLPSEINCHFLSYISFCRHLMVDSFIVEKESR